MSTSRYPTITNGDSQTAEVTWLDPDWQYRAPELHMFDVRWVDASDHRVRMRGCCANDIVLERDARHALLDVFAVRA